MRREKDDKSIISTLPFDGAKMVQFNVQFIEVVYTV